MYQLLLHVQYYQLMQMLVVVLLQLLDVLVVILFIQVHVINVYLGQQHVMLLFKEVVKLDMPKMLLHHYVFLVLAQLLFVTQHVQLLDFIQLVQHVQHVEQEQLLVVQARQLLVLLNIKPLQLMVVVLHVVKEQLYVLQQVQQPVWLDIINLLQLQ